VQHLVEQPCDRARVLRLHSPPHAAFERRRGVLPEVEAVLPIDAFEEQLELDGLEIQPPLGRLGMLLYR